MQAKLVEISIITAVSVYNDRLAPEKTIQNIASQTYENIEYIVIDGRSTDGTLAVINKFSHHIDHLVTEAETQADQATDNARSQTRHTGIQYELLSMGADMGLDVYTLTGFRTLSCWPG